MPLKHTKTVRQMRNEMHRFKRDAPRIVGVEALKFIERNFRRQGFADTVNKPWAKRKRSRNSRDSTRAILVKSGLLKSAFRKKISGFRLEIINPLPYASAHNEGAHIRGVFNVSQHSRRSKKGGAVNVSSHSRRVDFKIKKRKFMGNSRLLNRIIKIKLIRHYKHIIR